MTSNVLVTGGTGALGQVLVPRLLSAGADVSVLSRSAGAAPPGVRRRVADLTDADDAALARALQDVDTVVHLASDPAKPTSVDVQGTERLVTTAARSGVQHVVLLSIVGCDANPFAYYRAKAAAEAVVLSGPVPGSVLRATQFHDLVPRLAETLVRGRVAFVPKGLRAQLVDLRDVADRLVTLVEAGPSGRVRDLAGPEVVTLPDAVTRWSRATGRSVPRVVHLPAVGRVLRSFAAGSNLPGPQAQLGRRTFDDWLRELSA
ncbi:MAG TPA: NAD(P)-dependent oxidoreductase [Angustibacter sp.]|nr:NAD(P)-dependent oxidoreductase [Angustibacter sp.]